MDKTLPVFVDESLPANTVMMPREMSEKLNSDKETVEMCINKGNIGINSFNNSGNIIDVNVLLSDTITDRCLISTDIVTKTRSVLDFDGDLINKFLL